MCKLNYNSLTHYTYCYGPHFQNGGSTYRGARGVGMLQKLERWPCNPKGFVVRNSVRVLDVLVVNIAFKTMEDRSCKNSNKDPNC